VTFTPENRARVNALIARVVQPIAEAHNATVGQVVLAWTVAQPGITSALAGARTADQVRENAAAGDLVLTVDEIACIRNEFEALKLDVPGGTGARAKIRRLVKRLIGE
jgi:aryl-alcohol dehydrogenase-like predicted oxidoreductase